MSHRRSEFSSTPSVFGTRRVADAARKVIRLINAITRDEANERFGAWFLWAKDEKDIDAAFRAVQILRDLDTLDPEEAAYLFAQLLRRGPVFMKLNDEAVTYLRAHGESEIAALFVDHPTLFKHALESAADSLIDRKPLDDDYRRPKDKPAKVAVVAERVLALSASSEGPEREAAWAALMKAMKGVSIEARVHAVSRLKDVGALSRPEHAALVHHLSTERYVPLAQFDRENRRRFRSDGLGRGPELTPSPLTRPERTHETRLMPRSIRIHVACLRQLGEHDLANLMLASSDAYYALVKEGDASMPDAAHPERARNRARRQAAGEPSEAELDQVVDSWANLLTDAEDEAFWNRLGEDEEFMDRVVPILKLFREGKATPSLNKRLALRRAERRMATRPPVKRKPPNKTEVDLIKRYIDNKLSAEDEQLFEARLLADDRFFARVAPYVRIWLMADGQSPTAIEAGLKKGQPSL